MAESESRRQALWYQRPENLPRLMELWETCTDRGERIPALLREAERLQDENEALRAALRDIADAYERDMLAEIGHANIDEIREARKLLGVER